MGESLVFTVIKSLAWKFCERGGLQVVQFVIGIVLARILSPADYGAVALLVIFTSIASVFVQSGLSSALIQKKDATEEDFSSVAIYCLLVAGFIYGVLYVSAASIAAFYHMPKLVALLRVLALILFPGAIASIQLAFLTKNLSFKIQFYTSLIAAVLSGTLGIILALRHFGPWALVAQQLSYQVLLCIILWFWVPWRPTFTFSYRRTKSLLQFGSKLLGATLIDTIYHNLESLALGKKYSADVLAFCNKGKMFPLILINNMDGAIQQVMFSVYSRKQDDMGQIKQMLRRTMAVNTFFVFPAMFGLACVAKPLILLVLGEKWLPAVAYLQLYCFISALFPLQTANLQAINALGRSDVYFKLITLKRVVGVLVLAVAVIFCKTPLSIVWACLLTEVMGVVINFPQNIRLLDYQPRELLADLLPNFWLAGVMALLCYSLLYVHLSAWLLMPLQCMVGGIIYVALAWVQRNPNLQYIVQKIQLIKKKRI